MIPVANSVSWIVSNLAMPKRSSHAGGVKELEHRARCKAVLIPAIVLW